jgi:hypothetical protein
MSKKQISVSNDPVARSAKSATINTTKRTTTMDKTKLLSELHAIISSRQRGRWLVKGEDQLSSALRALDLALRGENQGSGGGASHKPGKGSNKVRRGPGPMSLSDEINFELLAVFMGMRSLQDVPRILRKNGLITDSEFDECKEWCTVEDPEIAAKSCVRKAYFRWLAGLHYFRSTARSIR